MQLHRPCLQRRPEQPGPNDRPRTGNASAAEPEKAPEPAAQEDNIDELRRQMKDMQDRLERMSKEPKSE